MEKLRKIRDFVTARSAAVTCTAGSGAATAHFCAHPCPEHAGIAILCWCIGLACALRDRFHGGA